LARRRDRSVAADFDENAEFLACGICCNPTPSGYTKVGDQASPANSGFFGYPQLPEKFRIFLVFIG
jgi:hypothetical protein